MLKWDPGENKWIVVRLFNAGARYGEKWQLVLELSQENDWVLVGHEGDKVVVLEKEGEDYADVKSRLRPDGGREDFYETVSSVDGRSYRIVHSDGKEREKG